MRPGKAEGKRVGRLLGAPNHGSVSADARWLAGALDPENRTYAIVVKRSSPQERRRKRAANHDGSPRVTQRDRVIAMLSENEVVASSQFVAAGIHRPTISHMLRDGTIDRVGFGLYKLAERQKDQS